VAVVVENIPADADTRLRKQLRDLLSQGYRVSVITQAGEENQPYREVRNLTLLEYPHPLNPAVRSDTCASTSCLDGSSPPSLAAEPSVESHAIALNATKAAEVLGWRPAVDVAEGIRRKIRWLCATLEPEPSALLGA
jgi:hypothetical protein